jgi:pimeloyl-ACP methyl ester carboxylesterase
MADRFVEIDGAKIRYQATGSGPPILLLHGLGAFLESWNRVLPGLTQRHTAIAIDLPGFGLSAPLESAYNPEGAAGFVLRFLDTLSIRRAVLIGSSLGGAIATLAAGRAPERCAGLVLVAPAGFGPWVTPAARLATVPLVGESFIRVIKRHPWIGVRNAFIHRDRLPPDLIEMTRRSFADGAAGAATIRIVRNTIDLRGVKPPVLADVRRAAARVTAPSLVIWGTRDRVVPPAYVTCVAEALQGVDIRMIEGAGHVPYIEQVDAFLAAVREFLARTSPPAEVARRR